MLSWALASYIIVLSITPGPNNVLLAASGVNYGVRRTLPMTFGICVGGGIQCALTMLLFSQLMEYLHYIRLPIAVLGCLYLLWLSWRIYKANAPQGSQKSRPMTFLQAALFQWVNPKAWIMMLNMAALFMPASGSIVLASLSIGFINTLVSYPSVFLWALLGDRLRLALENTRYLQCFNSLMGGTLAATAIWLLYDELDAVLFGS